MRITTVVILLFMLCAGQGSAGIFDDAFWKKGEIAAVLDRTDGLKSVVTEFQGNRTFVDAQLRETIEAYFEELQSTITKDRQGLGSYLGAGGNCNAGSLPEPNSRMTSSGSWNPSSSSAMR